MKLRSICKSDRDLRDSASRRQPAGHRERRCRTPLSAGDRIIIALVLTDERIVPRMVAVDEHNRLLRHLTGRHTPEPVTT
jgi:hypothetical protein